MFSKRSKRIRTTKYTWQLMVLHAATSIRSVTCPIRLELAAGWGAEVEFSCVRQPASPNSKPNRRCRPQHSTAGTTRKVQITRVAESDSNELIKLCFAICAVSVRLSPLFCLPFQRSVHARRTIVKPSPREHSISLRS